MGVPPRQIPQIPNIARMIATLTQANGGATWNLVEGDLAGRPLYAVSVFEDRERSISFYEPDLNLAVEIEDFIRSNRPLLVEDPNVSIGTWLSEGHIHLDLSITVASLADALALGQEHDQLAIYDLANNVEIPVPAAAAESAA